MKSRLLGIFGILVLTSTILGCDGGGPPTGVNQPEGQAAQPPSFQEDMKAMGDQMTNPKAANKKK